MNHTPASASHFLSPTHTDITGTDSAIAAIQDNQISTAPDEYLHTEILPRYANFSEDEFAATLMALTTTQVQKREQPTTPALSQLTQMADLDVNNTGGKTILGPSQQIPTDEPANIAPNTNRLNPDILTKTGHSIKTPDNHTKPRLDNISNNIPVNNITDNPVEKSGKKQHINAHIHTQAKAQAQIHTNLNAQITAPQAYTVADLKTNVEKQVKFTKNMSRHASIAHPSTSAHLTTTPNIDTNKFVPIEALQKVQRPAAHIITQAPNPTDVPLALDKNVDKHISRQLQTPSYGQVQVQTQVPVQGQAVTTQLSTVIAQHIPEILADTSIKPGTAPKPILVQLSPAELGRVHIQFNFDGHEKISVHIISESAETSALLKQKSDILLTQLRLNGFDNIDLGFEIKTEKGILDFSSNGAKQGSDGFMNTNGHHRNKFAQHLFANQTAQQGEDEINHTLQPGVPTVQPTTNLLTDALDITL